MGPKDRDSSPTGSVAATSATTTDALALKKGVLKVAAPDTYKGERHKFEAFIAQVRLYWYADSLRPRVPVDTREMRTTTDNVMWAASYLRGDAQTRFQPYLLERLEKGTNAACSPDTYALFNDREKFIQFLQMSYGDLNKTRTAELELNRLRQVNSFPEYLTRFTQYAAQVSWDERARMARLYEGLKDNIKEAMALQEFPTTWEGLVSLAARLDDNQRRRKAEKSGWNNRFHNQKPNRARDPDAMDLSAGSATKQYRKQRGKNGEKTNSPKKKGKCFNCGKPGHFAKECRSPKQANGAKKEKQPSEKSAKRANLAQKSPSHETMHWSACYDDGCLVHLSGKDNNDYFPQRGRKNSREDTTPRVVSEGSVREFRMAYGEEDANSGAEEYDDSRSLGLEADAPPAYVSTLDLPAMASNIRRTGSTPPPRMRPIVPRVAWPRTRRSATSGPSRIRTRETVEERETEEPSQELHTWREGQVGTPENLAYWDRFRQRTQEIEEEQAHETRGNSSDLLSQTTSTCADPVHQELEQNNAQQAFRLQVQQEWLTRTTQERDQAQALAATNENNAKEFQDYVSVLQEHVENLTTVIQRNEDQQTTDWGLCGSCGQQVAPTRDATTQTYRPDTQDPWYFLEEIPPPRSHFRRDGGYVTPEGVYITARLRTNLRDLRIRYRQRRNNYQRMTDPDGPEPPLLPPRH
jgi:Retrotransposon gag protein/Zinc knuckle